MHVVQHIRRQPRGGHEELPFAAHGIRENGKSNIGSALWLAPVDSLVVYGAHRQVALERRNFLFKPQDPFIDTLQRRRLSGLDHPVKLAQGPSPPCAGGRWRLYCSHIRSRKLSGHWRPSTDKRTRFAQELSVAYSPYLAVAVIRIIIDIYIASTNGQTSEIDPP